MTPVEGAWSGRLAVVDDDYMFSNAIQAAFENRVPKSEVRIFTNAEDLFSEHARNEFDAVLWDYSGDFGMDRQKAAKEFTRINHHGVFLLTSGHFSRINSSSMVIPKPIEDIPGEIVSRILKLSRKHTLARQVLYTTVFSCLQGVLHA